MHIHGDSDALTTSVPYTERFIESQKRFSLNINRRYSIKNYILFNALSFLY